MSVTPTAEQVKALQLFSTGRSLVVEAGAGTGKTSTLVLMAESTRRRGIYLAFNRSIVEEAQRRMPSNVTAKTVHSFAWRAVVGPSAGFKARLASRERVRSDQLARALGVDPFTVKYGDKVKVVQPGHIASLAMRAIAIFCNSDDLRPGEQHVPYVDGIDQPTADGRRTYESNDKLRRIVADLLPRVWADLSDPHGNLPFRHDHYLKVWELSHPKIDADFILFDEGQDASPVMRSIVEQQRARGVQVVYVGDSQQAIYEWRGAVNALELAETDDRTFITQSFRFGPAVADAANAVLSVIDGAELRLSGTEGIPSVVAREARPRAVLCRTNAVAVEHVLQAQTAGLRPYLMGGGDEIARFARAATELQTTGRTSHPELACFDSWQQVTEYVANDPSGDELALLVRLIETYGPETIIRALDRMPSEANADLVVSTAHKAKGREWDSVKVAWDFAYPKAARETASPRDLTTAELRLMYVAVTRAKLTLDPFDSEPLVDLLGLRAPEPGSAEPVPEAPVAQAVPTAPILAPAAAAVPAPAPTPVPAPATQGTAHRPAPARNGYNGYTGYNGPERPATDLAARTAYADRHRHSPVGAAPTATRETELAWWIGRCVTGCPHAAKLYGRKAFDGERFLGFFDADGKRVYLPKCEAHQRRPFMKRLVVKPPKPTGKCNASCWNAKSDECDCPCQGSNHGSGHAPVATLDAHRKAAAS